MSDESNDTISDDEPKANPVEASEADAPADPEVDESAAEAIADGEPDSGETDSDAVEDPAAEADATDDGGDESEDADADARADDASAPAGKDAEERAARRAKADAAIAARTVNRRTVTSRRVTPKGGAKVEAAPIVTSKARDAKKTETVVARSVTPVQQQAYAKGPSPWWVPAIMFGFLIIGALVIMTNYMGVFGDASNIRLVLGLGFILGGIVTATQYR